MGTVTAGDKLTATLLNLLADRVVAHGRRSTNSTGTTTIVGVERLDDIPITAGRAYTIKATNVLMLSTVANDVVEVTIRYTTNGSTPTTGSTVLPGSKIFSRMVAANSGESRHIETQYIPSANQTLSLLLCVARFAGTGTVSLAQSTDSACDLKVLDEGVAPADTGTDI